jgi:4-hydroxybenzoate polyprenyltransferase/antitoxin component of RelBE/YafQ-DinJ toxin-antitoxin module
MKQKQISNQIKSVQLERDIISSDLGVETFLLALREAPTEAIRMLVKGYKTVPELPFHPRALRYNNDMISEIKTLRNQNVDVQIESSLPPAWVNRILHHIGLGQTSTRDKEAGNTAEEILPVGKQTTGPAAFLKALRPHQWSKNILIFVPLLMAHRMFDLQALQNTILAFICFGFVASSIYIMNDLMDLHQDRRHEKKRNRPFASGSLSVVQGLLMMPFLLGGAIYIATQLPQLFGLTMVAYLVMNLGYTFYLKRKLLVDVLALSGAYTLRILAGNAAGPVDVSNWLLAFSLFLFLSLALVKRYTELDAAPEEVDVKKRVMGRGYRKSDLDMVSQLGVSSGFSAIVVLAIFIDGASKSAMYQNAQIIWLVAPIVLYVIGRIWMLAKRREMNDDPIMFILKDWRSHLMGAIVATIIYVAI